MIDLGPVKPMDFGAHLGTCPYFAVDAAANPFTGCCGKDSFHALLITDGTGALTCGQELQILPKGSCAFLPAGSGEYILEGNYEALDVYVPSILSLEK